MFRFLGSMLTVSLLAACSNGQTLQTVPSGTSSSRFATHGKSIRHGSVTESVVYRFGSHYPDGYSPSGSLIELGGVLYGGTRNYTAGGGGTIFSVTPSGTETVLRELTRPQGYMLGLSLTLAPNLRGNGKAFYGTGSGVGKGYNGTVFEITRSGKLSVLYRFAGGTDGAQPRTTLTEVGGTFYGVTLNGGDSTCGSSGCGTVFSVTPSGNEAVVYRFMGSPDGAVPIGTLANVNGTLYGTTIGGGTGSFCGGGCGTVFEVSRSGAESVLHSFQGGSSDGAFPSNYGLIDVNGTLYGTTGSGGSGTGCGSGVGCGTVFSVTASGTETILYSFSGTNAVAPQGLVEVNGALYGTTYYGGSTACGGDGCGTVFRITPSGGFKVVYRFMGGTDGEFPVGNLINAHGTLYGMTANGGDSSCDGGQGCGTVFALTL